MGREEKGRRRKSQGRKGRGGGGRDVGHHVARRPPKSFGGAPLCYQSAVHIFVRTTHGKGFRRSKNSNEEHESSALHSLYDVHTFTHIHATGNLACVTEINY